MNCLPIVPNQDVFVDLAKTSNVIPMMMEFAADIETPLSAFIKLRQSNGAFLLESAEGSEKAGRWSIVGSNPKKTFEARGKQITVREGNTRRFYEAERDVLEALEQEMSTYKVAPCLDLPVFSGGLVGYLSYDAVRQFEPSLGDAPNDSLGIPDAFFLLVDRLLVFDHRMKRIHLIINVILEEHVDVSAAYQYGQETIQAMMALLNQPIQVKPLVHLATVEDEQVVSNTTQEEYEAMVLAGKEYIKSGDIFQFVPSQRFEVEYSYSAIELYRALRLVNPSPYMFLMELEHFSLVGSSPEVHVRCINGKIDIRPIAGTRKRGANEVEDDALAQDLLADAKEVSEHLMLVDLARNDVGRIAQHGKVTVDEFMIIERYSHVMHIVSNVCGELDEAHSAYDVLRATFPAGTVSGAPKIRAMQIINDLEKNKRCAYAGAVGYFGFDGNHDSCITLRTCLLKDGKVYVQAGAGVVADSDPTSEYQETVNKAKGMLRAVAVAKQLARTLS